MVPIYFLDISSTSSPATLKWIPRPDFLESTNIAFLLVNDLNSPNEF